MMSQTQTPSAPQAPAQEALALARRGQLNRSLKLLRQLRDALVMGDTIPPLAEVARLTGLQPPEGQEPGPGVLALIEAATEERKDINRRLRLARALEEAAAAAAEDDAPAPQAPSPRASSASGLSPQASPVARSSTPATSPLDGEADRLSRISARELDRLPYGAILLDNSGRIIAYNDTESRMARLPVEAVIGRNFFTEVAPCTRVKGFEGRFRALAGGEGPQVSTFDFTFPFPFGAQHVSVMLTRGVAAGTVIMALLRR